MINYEISVDKLLVYCCIFSKDFANKWNNTWLLNDTDMIYYLTNGHLNIPRIAPGDKFTEYHQY